MDAVRTATKAHGSTETNAMRADCIAAGSSGLARAQAMLTGETYSCSQRNDGNGKGERGATLAALAACKLRQRQKGVNHGRFVKEKTKRTARCAVAMRRKHRLRNCCGTSLACKRGVQCAVCTVQVQAGEGQSPDLTSSHREVQLTRSAALA